MQAMSVEDAGRAFHHILAIWDDCSFLAFKDAFLRKTEEPIIIIITRHTYVRPIQPQLKIYITHSQVDCVITVLLLLALVGWWLVLVGCNCVDAMTILNDITLIWIIGIRSIDWVFELTEKRILKYSALVQTYREITVWYMVWHYMPGSFFNKTDICRHSPYT